MTDTSDKPKREHGPVSFTLADVRAGRVHVISDTHFGHTGIISLALRPGWSADGEHDELRHELDIFARWKEVVRDDDWVLHLGDVAWSGAGCRRAAEAELPGIVEVIEGNHDGKSQQRDVRNKLGWRFVDPITIDWSLTRAASEKHGLPERTISRRVYITHYPMRHLPEGAVCLHGHDHGTTVFFEDEDPSVRYDHRYRSVSLERTMMGPLQLAAALDMLLMQSDSPGAGNTDQQETQTMEIAERNRLT